jgi:hypothetical protein
MPSRTSSRPTGRCSPTDNRCSPTDNMLQLQPGADSRQAPEVLTLWPAREVVAFAGAPAAHQRGRARQARKSGRSVPDIGARLGCPRGFGGVRRRTRLAMADFRRPSCDVRGYGIRAAAPEASRDGPLDSRATPSARGRSPQSGAGRVRPQSLQINRPLTPGVNDIFDGSMRPGESVSAKQGRGLAPRVARSAPRGKRRRRSCGARGRLRWLRRRPGRGSPRRRPGAS